MSSDDHQDRREGRPGVVHVEGELKAETGGAAMAGGAVRLRLRPSVETVRAPNGDLLIVRGGTRATEAIADPRPEDVALIDALAGGWRTVAELEARFGDVGEALAALDGTRMLEWRTAPGESPLAADRLERFDRQLPYFADVLPARSPEEVQRSLAARHVAVLGCGGLGSWAIQALALSGIGRLTLIDPDTVELSNLNRQALYGAADVGRRKVVAARESVARLDAEIEVHVVGRAVASTEDAVGALRGADVVIQTADSPPYELERWVNRACVQLGTPHISAAQQPPLLRIGPFVIPGHTACYACQEEAARREYPLYDALVAERRRRPSVAATLGVASGVIGTMLATEALHHLIGLMPPTAGAALMVDFSTWGLEWERFERDPACPVCTAQGI
jgi:molybdopterin-synthase adenylyltransferase